MNITILAGNIGKSPEIRYTQAGMAVCNFSLATNKKVKGEKETQWHRIVSFGKTAEAIEKYCNKGDEIKIVGEIKYGSYEKDGHTNYTTDIILNQFEFGQKKAQEHSYKPNPGQREQQPIPDDQIPF